MIERFIESPSVANCPNITASKVEDANDSLDTLSDDLADAIKRVADGDAVSLQFADEVVGHGFAQIAATVEQRHESSAAGEPDGGLTGGVARANQSHFLIGAQLGFEGRCPIVNTCRFERIEVLYIEPPVTGAGSKHHGARFDPFADLQV